VSPERAERLHELEERIGHRFTDLALLDRALTHSSRANEEDAAGGHNEPLEFLGDSIIGFVMADLLHRRDPEGREGAKSKTRAQLVSSRTLARRAAELGLPELMRLGRGEEKTGGRKKAALWADAYEAVIAALYLDGGVEAAHRFISAEFATDLERPVLADEDHKSALQEMLQARGDPVPEYEMVATEGPDHRRRFRVRCLVRGEPVGQGEGFSKKQAEQEAARDALGHLGG
jgi:ribonuclease III